MKQYVLLNILKIRQIGTNIIPGYVYMCQNDLHKLEQFEKVQLHVMYLSGGCEPQKSR